MEIHIHDQSEQLNSIERKKLFRTGEAATVPDPGCAAVITPKAKATSQNQTESCPEGDSRNKCQSVAILILLQPAPETPRLGKAMHVWGQVQLQTRTRRRQSVR